MAQGPILRRQFFTEIESSSLGVRERRRNAPGAQHLDSSWDRQRLIKAIIALGQSLDLTVIAEGIETLSHLKILESYGCDAVQGFYLAKPMSGADFGQWLARSGDPGLADFPSNNRTSQRIFTGRIHELRQRDVGTRPSG